MDDHEETFESQTAIAVARRALILSGVVCRASIETYTDDEYKRETTDSIRDWFSDLNLWPYLEPDERKIICSAFGEMSLRLRIRGTWFVEGLSLLAWSLGRYDFPAHDQKVDPIEVTNSLDFLDAGAHQILGAPRLRDAAELHAAREWFYDVHSTLRSVIHYGGTGRLPHWIADYAQVLGLAPDCVLRDGFLLLDGKPIAESHDTRAKAWEEVICERHRAAIWLLGEHPVYTELNVDT